MKNIKEKEKKQGKLDGSLGPLFILDTVSNRREGTAFFNYSNRDNSRRLAVFLQIRHKGEVIDTFKVKVPLRGLKALFDIIEADGAVIYPQKRRGGWQVRVWN